MLLKFVSFVAALALILALSLPIIAPAAPAPGATTAAAAEPHPAIRAAIRSLERAGLNCRMPIMTSEDIATKLSRPATTPSSN